MFHNIPSQSVASSEISNMENSKMKTMRTEKALPNCTMYNIKLGHTKVYELALA